MLQKVRGIRIVRDQGNFQALPEDFCSRPSEVPRIREAYAGNYRRHRGLGRPGHLGSNRLVLQKVWDIRIGRGQEKFWERKFLAP